MKTSLSSRNKLIYSIIIAACVLYASYALLISGTLKETKAVKEETAALQAELRELQPYIDNKAVYAKQIDDNNAQIAQLVDQFLPEITHKDLIAYTQDMWTEHKDKTLVLAFEDPIQIADINYKFGEDRDHIGLYNRRASLTYEVAYDDLKAFLKDIKDTDLKVYMTDFNASLDQSTNHIVGSFEIIARSADGSNKVDTTYNTRNVPAGVRNVFGDYSAEPITE